MQIKQYFFSMNMAYPDFLPYYQGQASVIVVTTTQGLRIQFPAAHLRKFITPNGICGYFRLETKNNKFFSLTKLQ
jgi:uncharacterized protein DUF2835